MQKREEKGGKEQLGPLKQNRGILHYHNRNVCIALDSVDCLFQRLDERLSDGIKYGYSYIYNRLFLPIFLSTEMFYFGSVV